MTGSSIAPGISVARHPTSWESAEQSAAEDERLAILRSYGVLDTEAEELFDSLTELAAELCGTSMALVSLVDRDRQWFKAALGLDVCETSRADSFCAHALHRTDPMVVPDARSDPRFVANPLVTGPPYIRFYAGAPLITPTGHTLGTLCVLDERAGVLTERQTRQLTILAGQVMGQLTGRMKAGQLASEIAARRESEAALAANDRLLRGVLSHPDAMIYAKDLGGRYILTNDSLHRLLRAEADELLGHTDHDLMPAAAADGFRLNDVAVVEQGERIVVAEQFATDDGTIRHFVSTKFPLRDEAGAIYAVAGVSTDVTAQRAAQAELENSERRWRQLFDGSPVGIGLSDHHGVIVAANPQLCALYGRAEHDVVGHNELEFAHPDDLRQHRSNRSLLAAADDEIVQIERRVVHPDGEVRWAWVSITTTPGPDGTTWTLSHAQDITARLQTEKAVRDSEANLSAVAAVVKQIQAGGDARQTIVTACADLSDASVVCLLEPTSNGSALQITTTNVPRLQGITVPFQLTSDAGRVINGGRDLFIPVARDDPALLTLPFLSASDSAYLVPVMAGDSGAAVLAVAWDVPVAEVSDRRARVVTLLADQAGVALRQNALLSELGQLAVTDTLTGLPNRRGWDHAINSLIAGRQPGDELVVALIDFDHFKLYNDTMGHHAGDQLLRDFASGARGGLRSGDVLARWGGEEFVMALRHRPGTDVDAVLNRIADAMPDGQTCSIGYAEVAPGEDIAQVMIEADAALYIAKNNGRNQIRHFETDRG